MGVDNMVRMVSRTATPAMVIKERLNMDEKYERDTEQLKKMKMKLWLKRTNSL